MYRKGSVCRGRLFSVHALPNTIGRPRLGLSVSKKVGTAVKRNLVRRRLKEIFRSLLADVPGDLDLFVSARSVAAHASFEELEGEFRRALGKLERSLRTRDNVGLS